MPSFPALQPWQNFYMLTGAAAATLTGLMFVAVTFGAGLVSKENATSARAFLDPTLLHFVQVLFTACVLTVPTITSSMLGWIFVTVAAFRLLGLVRVFASYREAHRVHGDIELSDWVMAVVVPLVFHTLLLGTGAAFLEEQPRALSGLAIVTLGLLLVGIYGAWELLVWMAWTVVRRSEGGATGPAKDEREA